jgi:hypothetical protein
VSDYGGWYEPAVELAQGSIVRSFPFIQLDDSLAIDSGHFTRRDADFVVLTQTCDIPKPAQRDLLLAEMVPYDVIAGVNDGLASKQGRQGLARGTSIAEFLLPPSSELKLGWTVVSFRSLFVVPKKHVKEHGSEFAVATPYREHLAQAYARFTMRVGLPSPLHAFEQYVPKTK